MNTTIKAEIRLMGRKNRPLSVRYYHDDGGDPKEIVQGILNRTMRGEVLVSAERIPATYG